MVKKAVQKLYLGNQEVNLATSGVYPEGTINITENGVYDVTTYKNANVSSLTQTYRGFKNEEGVLMASDEKINLEGVTSIGNHAMYGFCNYNDEITGSPFVNSEDLTYITEDYACYNAFQYCKNITRTGLNSVKEIGDPMATSSGTGYCAYGMYKGTGVTDVELDNLEKVRGYYAAGYMFGSCKDLEVVRFLKLNEISGTSPFSYTFSYCDKLHDVYYPALKTYTSIQAVTYAGGGDGNLKVHFRMDADFKDNAVIQSGFGGDATVLFDQGDFVSKIHLPVGSSYRVYYSVNGSFAGLTEIPTDTEGDYVVAQVNACEGTGIYLLIVVDESNVFYDYYTPTEADPDVYITPDFTLCSEITPDSNYQTGVEYTLSFHRFNFLTLHTSSGGSFKFSQDSSVYDIGYLQLTGVYDNTYPSTVSYVDSVPTLGTSETWSITIDVYKAKNVWTGAELAQILDPSIFDMQYWSVTGDSLQVAPTVKTTVTTNSAFGFMFIPDVSYIKVKLTYSLGSENNYDFGYMAIGNSLISRTSSQIKNQDISDGMYLFRETGAQTSPRTEEVTVDVSTGLITGTKYITIGWGQDSSTTSNGNYFRIDQLEITQY